MSSSSARRIDPARDAVPEAGAAECHDASVAPVDSWLGSITPASLTAALPDLAFGAGCLLTWIWPDRMPGWMLQYIVLVMLLEFIVIHSSAILGSMAYGDDPKKKRLGAVLGLGAFYSVFVIGFSLAFKTAWPLITFWGQTLNRLMGAMMGPGVSGKQKLYIQSMWAATAMFYLGGVFLTTLLPIPRLGITSAVESAANLPGSGLWIDDPWRPAAFGFLYFTGVGLVELFQEHWLRNMKPLVRR